MKILYIGNKLSRHGYTPTGVEYLGDLLERGGYAMVYASDKKNSSLRMIDMLMAIMRHRSSDLILIDTYSSRAFYFAWLSGMLARTLGIPYVLILRGGDLRSRVSRRPRLVRSLFAHAARVVSVSKYLQHVLADFYVTTYIPNTIDLEKYAFRERTAVRPRLLWVRSLHSVYNPELAIDIVAKLKRQFPDTSLVMVGPDKEGLEGRLRGLAKLKGVHDQIKWTGKLSKEEWIHLSEECDIFINTTNVDNMPVSVTEALALGLPVISTNVGGMPFLIADNVEGILVPPNDSDTFCMAIQRLLQRPDVAREIARRGRIKAESFDNQVVLRQWNKLIHEVLQ